MNSEQNVLNPSTSSPSNSPQSEAYGEDFDVVTKYDDKRNIVVKVKPVERRVGNAPTTYYVRFGEKDTDKSSHGVFLSFHSTKLDPDVGYEGFTNEVLFRILQDRLRGFNSGEFACRENYLTLNHLSKILRILEIRENKARCIQNQEEMISIQAAFVRMVWSGSNELPLEYNLDEEIQTLRTLLDVDQYTKGWWTEVLLHLYKDGPVEAGDMICSPQALITLGLVTCINIQGKVMYALTPIGGFVVKHIKKAE